MGADPSWRARLGSHLVAEKERKMSAICTTDLSDKSDDVTINIESAEDKFLVCIFNVSPTVTHTMFHVSKTSTASDVIKLALERGRHNKEDHEDYVLVEETEIKALKKKNNKAIQRMLNNDENIFLVQSSWKESGKLTLLERSKADTKFHILDNHPGIRETQSDPIGSPRLRRPNGLVNRVRRFSRSFYPQHALQESHEEPCNFIVEREAISDGELSNEEDSSSDRTRKVSKAFRKIKIW